MTTAVGLSFPAACISKPKIDKSAKYFKSNRSSSPLPPTAVAQAVRFYGCQASEVLALTKQQAASSS